MPSNEDRGVDDPAAGPTASASAASTSTSTNTRTSESSGSSLETDTVTSNVVSEPSDAFQALGNEIRIGILETMLEHVDVAAPDDDHDSDDDPTRPRLTFSELFETTGLETSAQFAYHLEQLVGPYLRKTESGYELTYSGLQIARAIATGAYTHRVDHAPISLAESCPFCEADALEAQSTDNVVTVTCRACDRSLLSLQFPPAGLVAHGESGGESDSVSGGETDSESGGGGERASESESKAERGRDSDSDRGNEGTETDTGTERDTGTETEPARETKTGAVTGTTTGGLPDAFDRYHRHQLALMRDGVCPECSGDIDATLEPVSAVVEDALPEALTDHVQASFECQQCGHDLRAPVTLTLLQHPAIVSFYYDHGQDVRDRPIWNVGHEWSESVLSTDPLCVRVVVELEDDVLALYVDASLRVVEVQRAESGSESESESGPESESEPAPVAETRTETVAETSSTTDGTDTVDTATTDSSTTESSESTTSA